MYYYYLKNDQKVGPYTLEELQSLQLPLNTSIWCDGWEKSKSISDCPEVLSFLLSNAPAIPLQELSSEHIDKTSILELIENTEAEKIGIDDTVIIEENNVSPTSEETITIYPELHWLPKTLMVLGLVASIGQIATSFIDFESPLILSIDIVTIVWGIISIGGMLAKTKWGLISYLIYRSLNLFLYFILAAADLFDPNELVKDFISFAMVLLIFLIKKDGYSVYDTLLNNGAIVEPKKTNTDNTNTKEE